MKKRRTLDNQGKPLVEVKDRDGQYAEDLDLSAIRKYKADELDLAATGSRANRRVPGTNPYQGSVATEKPLKRKSSLDYLRQLSVQIKKLRDDSGKE